MTVARRTLVVALSAAAAATAQSTRPAAPATPTARDAVLAKADFNRRTLGDAYAADGTPKDATDADARAFLEAMAVRWANAGVDPIDRTADRATTDRAVPLAKALGGCTNPIVNYCRAVIYRDAGDSSYEPLLREAAEGVIDGRYPAFRKWAAARALVRLSPGDAAAFDRARGLVVPTVLELSNRPQERRTVLETIIDDAWAPDATAAPRRFTAAERQGVLDELDKTADADPWVVNMLRGHHEIGVAWDYRGFGVAAGVTPEGRAGFREHIARARRALTAAHEKEPGYPEAAARMLTVCMAEGDTREAAEWFDRATAAQIDYATAWTAYSGCLQPRWGGSLDAMQRLARRAVATGRFDTLAPMQALTIYEQMGGELDAGYAVYRRPGAWEDVRDAIDGYTRAPKPGVAVATLRSRRAALARLSGQYAEAVKDLDALGPRAVARFFTATSVLPADARAECAAKSGPRADTFLEWDAEERAENFAAARDGYAGLLAAMPADDPDRGYAEQRHRAMNTAAAVRSGRTVPVPAAGPGDLAAWSMYTRHWTAADGVLGGTVAAENGTYVKLRAPLPSTYRLKMEWSWSSADAAAGPPLFAVVLQDAKANGQIMANFRTAENVIQIELDKQYNVARRRGAERGFGLSSGDWHTLEIVRTGRAVTLVHDGETVIDDVRSDWFGRGEPMLGLYLKPADGAATVRVRNLTLGQ